MARTHSTSPHRRRSSATEQWKERKKAVADMEALAILMLADAENDEEEMTAMLVAQIAVEDARNLRQSRLGRYGPRGPYNAQKSADFFDLLLYSFSDRWFKSWMRMDRKSFWYIHDLIHEDPIFKSTGKKPQRPPKYQLATFLSHVGSDSAIKTAAIMSIAEGTVYEYCPRVCQALLNLKHEFLAWPGTERREFLSNEMSKFGFPGCLGSGDGSYFRLSSKPKRNGYAYWCRKKFYALVIQATVDHRGIFTSYELGWPGSVQESRVWKNSDLWLNRNEYFREHEYILVDKGYPLTKFSIRPFNDTDLTNNPQESAVRKQWNRSLSRLRILVEHAFGRLKGRFPYLRGIPSTDLQETFTTIQTLMVLHNILESINDDPKTIIGFNGFEDDFMPDIVGDAPIDMAADDMYRQGLVRRKELVNLFLNRQST